MTEREKELYTQRIKEWKANQIKMGKSNTKPGQGTRDRIKKEVKKFLKKEREKKKKQLNKSSERAKRGYTFEEKVCNEFGWIRKESKPKCKWTGKGRNKFDKIGSQNKDPTLFKPILEESTFLKHDAITSEGKFVEIKKYDVKECKKWTLFSELLPCVKNYSDIPNVVKLFSDDEDMVEQSKVLLKQRKSCNSKSDKEIISEKLREMCKTISDDFNDFILKLGDNISNNYDILNDMTKDLYGIQVKGHLLKIEDLEFCWDYHENWCDCIRYDIRFRIKPDRLHKYGL